jgi:hypothetical protein
MLESATITVREDVITTSFNMQEQVLDVTIVEGEGEQQVITSDVITGALGYTPANSADVQTPVPANAVFTDTVYDDTALKNDVISFAISDTSSDLTAGDTDSFIAPYDFTLTGYFISVSEAPTGSNLVVDLKKNGVSVTSTNASIESGETSSITGIAPVISTSAFNKGDLITPNINQVGALTTGKSLKIYLEITKQ